MMSGGRGREQRGGIELIMGFDQGTWVPIKDSDLARKREINKYELFYFSLIEYGVSLCFKFPC